MATLGNDDLILAATTIRGLAMDGVQKAKSGHPGMPMGMADAAAVLWLKHLKHNPADPKWPDRDRFVLSGGHGSMLLYSLLHLAGYDLPLEQLMQFRQWDSKTPGHPEFGHTPGVETTTGPLGQGCANGVGMALAERMLAARFNVPETAIVDHYTYVFCGDGDLMEGLSHEAFSLAGHLKLNRLILFYDHNGITIEGGTPLAYSDDVKKRFQGYNWNVIEVDGHDHVQIDRAIRRAKRSAEKPTIIVCRTTIGKGSPNKQGTSHVHGEPLGDDEVKASKKNLGIPEDQFFQVPQRVRDIFAARGAAMRRQQKQWAFRFDGWKAANCDKAAAWDQAAGLKLPDNLESVLSPFDPAKPVATRNASGKVIQNLAKALPYFVGGSADLAPSTKTLIEGGGDIEAGAYGNRNFRFGIREHGMCGILNGIALHGGFRVFGATFFVFVDYCRPSVRLAAMMKLPVIYVFTHDSFYVGEDGPTHEPVEQLASLRCIPGMTVIRPADPTETAAAWVAALKNTTGPTALLLTRHDIPVLDRTQFPPASNVEKGAYTLWQSKPGSPDLLLIATGSEVGLALAAGKELASGCTVRVVSMPSWEFFERQPQAYRDDILPPGCRARVAVEAASPFGWERYVGDLGRVVTMNRFGASAPYKVLAEKFGFTTANVATAAREVLVRVASVR
jgi:transketolase